MSCARFEAALDAFVDGELDAMQRRAFDAHAAGCAGCARELALARAVSKGLAELGAIACPAEVAERASRSILSNDGARAGREVRGLPARKASLWKLAAACAAGIAVTAIAARQLGDGPSQQPVATRDADAEARAQLALRQLQWAIGFIGNTARASVGRVDAQLAERRHAFAVGEMVEALIAPTRSAEIERARHEGDRG